MTPGRVRPVILSGGAGTRLWPLSRLAHPKQLLALVTGRTMLEETALRVTAPGFGGPLVVCSADHRFLVAEQLRAAGVAAAAIVLEPVARGTAAAAAVAALMELEEEPESVLLVLPSDHTVADRKGFLGAVATGLGAARAGHLVTFGMRPEWAETGYGYIRAGAPLAGHDGCRAVERFVEKPPAEAAEGMATDGRHHWNSGMFLFRADRFLGELERFHPAIVEACRSALAGRVRDLDFVRLDADAFARAPAASIDVAVMERTAAAAVVPADIGWSDVGSWSALWRAAPPGAGGNVLRGDVVAEDVSGSFLYSEDRLLACVGVADMVVVVTADAVLVAPRERAQDVRAVVERLARDGRTEHLSHPRVHRPWGWFETMDRGAGFQVKRLCVRPGARLSLQRHAHRSEHWVVVAGTARVTVGDETADLVRNRSAYIPVGTAHRLENPGTEPLHVVEVQSGEILDENDIVRLADDYARG